MVGEVDHRRLVGDGVVVDTQAAVVGEGVANADVDVAGEAVVAVGASHGHFSMVFVGLNDLVDRILPTAGAAMQAVGAVVLWQLDGAVANLDASVADAIGVASHNGTEVRQVGFRQVVLRLLESLHHLYAVYCDAHDTCADVGELDLESLAVRQMAYFQMVGGIFHYG